MTDDDLDARLRALFADDAALDVAVPPGTDSRVLAATRRARRRTTSVRAVGAVAAVAAGGVVAVAAAGGGDGTSVQPAKRLPGGCQEYWSPPTPSPGETGEPFDAPTWTGPDEPPEYEVDPFPGGTWPGMTSTPEPQRGPRGGVLCTVAGDEVTVMTEEGFVWPTELPVPRYPMKPGEAEGQWSSPVPLSSEQAEEKGFGTRVVRPSRDAGDGRVEFGTGTPRPPRTGAP
jgi:hypothetical protein